MSNTFTHGFWFSKVDSEKRQVWGFATNEEPDKQGEIVDYDASIEAFKAWPGNIRAQHDRQKAVGTCISWTPVPERRGIWVGAQISRSRDGEDAWMKVVEGVLKGFSIGGEVIQTKPHVLKSGGRERTYNRITKYRLDELSLVDNPANPNASISVVKISGAAPEVTAPTYADAEIRKAIERVVRDVVRAGGGPTPQVRQQVGHAMATLDVDVIYGTRLGGLRVSKTASDGLFPATIDVAGGSTFTLCAKSAGGTLALYVGASFSGSPVRHRQAPQMSFLCRHASGSRVHTADLGAVRKAAETDGGWLLLGNFEHIVGADAIAAALTTSDDGVPPTAQRYPAYRDMERPGRLSTTDDDGVRSGGPSGVTPGEIRRRAGQPKVRPGAGPSKDPVLDRSTNQPWQNDPRAARRNSKIWTD
jgi:phage head maturation protease